MGWLYNSLCLSYPLPAGAAVLTGWSYSLPVVTGGPATGARMRLFVLTITIYYYLLPLASLCFLAKI